MIYRPLFITAFCLADFLVENELFQARQIIISQRLQQDRLCCGILVCASYPTLK